MFFIKNTDGLFLKEVTFASFSSRLSTKNDPWEYDELHDSFSTTRDILSLMNDGFISSFDEACSISAMVFCDRYSYDSKEKYTGFAISNHCLIPFLEFTSKKSEALAFTTMINVFRLMSYLYPSTVISNRNYFFNPTENNVKGSTISLIFFERIIGNLLVVDKKNEKQDFFLRLKSLMIKIISQYGSFCQSVRIDHLMQIIITHYPLFSRASSLIIFSEEILNVSSLEINELLVSHKIKIEALISGFERYKELLLRKIEKNSLVYNFTKSDFKQKSQKWKLDFPTFSMFLCENFNASVMCKLLFADSATIIDISEIN